MVELYFISITLVSKCSFAIESIILYMLSISYSILCTVRMRNIRRPRAREASDYIVGLGEPECALGLPFLDIMASKDKYYDARDWDKELNDLRTQLKGEKAALASALKDVRSWEDEARSLRRAWKKELEESDMRRMKINEMRYELDRQVRENDTLMGRQRVLETEAVELRSVIEQNKRELSMEKQRSAWLEGKVNELENAVAEWERRNALQREKEYEAERKKEEREKMKAEIKERIEMEEELKSEILAERAKKRKLD